MKKYWLFFLVFMTFLFLVCGVVEKLANRNPIIKKITANPSQIGTQDTTLLRVEANDPDGDMLTYNWESHSEGQLLSSMGEEVKWIAPSYAGRFQIKVKVTDENGGKATAEVYVEVRGDESPIVTITQPVENEIIPGLGLYTIKATVVFDWQIDRVEFFVDRDSLIFSDRTRPYEFTQWNVTALSGLKVLKAKAYEAGKPTNYGVDSVHVFIEGAIPIPKRTLGSVILQ